MTKQPKMPKWLTPSRKVYLIRLWTLYGNKCLLGHNACPHLSHYAHITHKAVTIAKAESRPCYDRHANPICDRDGTQLYLTVYKPVTSQISKVELTRLFELKTEQVIANWVREDRLQRQALLKVERENLHRTAERAEPLKGRFSGISRDIWHYEQPQFYIEGLGISGITLTPFAKVRLSSSYMRLFIDIAEAMRGISKNKKRKAIRYNRPLPKAITEAISYEIKQAVRHYLDH